MVYTSKFKVTIKDHLSGIPLREWTQNAGNIQMKNPRLYSQVEHRETQGVTKTHKGTNAQDDPAQSNGNAGCKQTWVSRIRAGQAMKTGGENTS